MTKLFSMKSLAFAGAAAFAVALAAAPQADAAKIAFDQRPEYVKNETTGDCEFTGKFVDNVYADTAYVLVSQSAVTCVDGMLEYYYSSVGSGKEAKKWTLISTELNYSDWDDDNYRISVPVGELAKGKAVDIYIAADADGTNKTTKIACKAAPKLKASISMLASGPSIKLMNGKDELKTGSITFSTQYAGEEGIECAVKDLEQSTDDLIATLKNIANFGGSTLNVYYYSEDAMTPSATAKLKVAATPKAPKESLKIAKAFTFKPKKDTMKYRAFVKDTLSEDLPDWSTGNNEAIAMNTLFAGNVSTTPIENEYVLNNTMQIQSKTIDKNKKKLDSRITTTTVYASAATPQAVNAVITNDVKSGKTTTTGASITFATTNLDVTQNKVVSSGAVVTLQYKTKVNGTVSNKWIDAKATAVKFASGKVPTEIYVRVKGVDYAAKKSNKEACYYEAPGHIMTIKIDVNDPASATYATTDGSIFVDKDNAKY